MNQCTVLAAVGLGLNLVWCTLMGHTLGFMSSASGIEPLVNPRLFFLVGILVFSLAYIVFPRLLIKADSLFRFVLPLLAASGTACFGLSYHQSFFDSAALAVGGLFVAGVSYFWLVARYSVLVVRTQGLSATVASVAGGLVVKLPILFVLSAFLNPETQVMIATVVPVITALIFEAACMVARKDVQSKTVLAASAQSTKADSATVCTVFGVPIPQRARKSLAVGDRRTVFILIVIAAVVLAVIRSVSNLGMWGNTSVNVSDVLPWLTGIVVPALFVIAFAYGALIRMADYALSIRFQPALLIIFVGLFVVAIQANPDAASFLFLSDVIQIDELFAHLLFWTVIATALEVLRVPPYRIIGIGGAIYAAASIAWVLLLGHAAILDTLLVMLATYALVIAALYATWFVSHKRTLESLSDNCDAEGQENSASPQYAVDTALNQEVKPKTVVAPPLGDTVSQTCLELAQSFALSPRETEVFILLAQGRTRTFIQEELVLSGSTVKTHVSHIYAKLNVHDRQEMMDLIWK